MVIFKRKTLKWLALEGWPMLYYLSSDEEGLAVQKGFQIMQISLTQTSHYGIINERLPE